VNEEALSHWGLSRQKKKNKVTVVIMKMTVERRYDGCTKQHLQLARIMTLLKQVKPLHFRLKMLPSAVPGISFSHWFSIFP